MNHNFMLSIDFLKIKIIPSILSKKQISLQEK